MAGRRSILCGAFGSFPLSPLLSNSVMHACLIWGMAGGSRLVCGVLMAGLSGFASHQCSLYFGDGCQ